MALTGPSRVAQILVCVAALLQLASGAGLRRGGLSRRSRYLPTLQWPSRGDHLTLPRLVFVGPGAQSPVLTGRAVASILMCTHDCKDSSKQLIRHLQGSAPSP